MEKHVSKHQPSIQDSNNNMGPFGLIRGIALLGSAINDKYQDNKRRAEHKKTLYDPETKTYQHNCQRWNMNDEPVSISYNAYGDKILKDKYGRTRFNYTDAERMQKWSDAKKVYGERITAHPFIGGPKNSYNYYTGNNCLDEITCRLVTIHEFKDRWDVSYSNEYREKNRWVLPGTSFYVDIQNGHLVRLSDVSNEINLRCKYNRKEYYEDDKIEQLIHEYNEWIDKQNIPEHCCTYINGKEPNRYTKHYVYHTYAWSVPKLLCTEAEKYIQEQVKLRKEI